MWNTGPASEHCRCCNHSRLKPCCRRRSRRKAAVTCLAVGAKPPQHRSRRNAAATRQSAQCRRNNMAVGSEPPLAVGTKPPQHDSRHQSRRAHTQSCQTLIPTGNSESEDERWSHHHAQHFSPLSRRSHLKLRRIILSPGAPSNVAPNAHRVGVQRQSPAAQAIHKRQPIANFIGVWTQPRHTPKQVVDVLLQLLRCSSSHQYHLHIHRMRFWNCIQWTSSAPCAFCLPSEAEACSLLLPSLPQSCEPSNLQKCRNGRPDLT